MSGVNTPQTETELRALLDEMYATAKSAHKNDERPAFKGLIEIMSAQATIMTAIHNIKSNKGSNTPGVDSQRMQKDYLQKPYEWVIADIQTAFAQFKPGEIRREYIDKPGKTEKRPLGIPTIRDRIVQECMRIVLEPIVEAQFFKHSYGFRPMRDTQMALARITRLVHRTGHYWIVEGDISKCFDRISHSILLKRLYHMGIKDRRVIQIIKLMLKAGIVGECEINDDGTPQGGILSPLLANAYLDIFDDWIRKQWEDKRTRYPYKSDKGLRDALRERSNLIPAYLVRYADDFVIVTNSKKHAEWWKRQITIFLNDKMRLDLSSEKTLITDIRKRHIHFLGYEYKVVRGKAKRGYITRTLPDRQRLKRKVDAIVKDIHKIPINASREQVIGEINRINSMIRGIINYYQNCTWVYIALGKHARKVTLAAKRRLKQYKGKWARANNTQNLKHIHEQYKQKLPSIKFRDIYIGVTSLNFCKWKDTMYKNQDETPFAEQGRQLYFERTKKKRRNDRLDAMYYDETSDTIAKKRWGKMFNFEFYMNRGYALNRDKLKCRVCGGWLIDHAPYTHHINPKLPLDKVNKVSNLVSVHRSCFNAIHNPNADISHYDTQARNKIKSFREKLDKSHVKTTA